MRASKACTRCGVVKPLEEFSPHRNGRRQSWCKECRRLWIAARRQEHPEVRLRQVAVQEARRRALRRLAKLHQREFRRLLAEEMAQVEGTERASA